MAASQFTPEQIQVYRKHFEVFDVNGDGVISAKELKKVSYHLGYRMTDDEINDIMHSRDLNDDGCLSFEEFLATMPGNLTKISKEEHRKAEVRRKFIEFDQDGNGFVTAGEAHEILNSELGFTPQQSIELVKHYDKNGDGHLSYEEFVLFYYKVRTKAEQMREMFDEFDTDKSGAVSIAEAKLMLRKLNIPDEEIETLVSQHDKNNDGELQYNEFVQFVLQS